MDHDDTTTCSPVTAAKQLLTNHTWSIHLLVASNLLSSSSRRAINTPSLLSSSTDVVKTLQEEATRYLQRYRLTTTYKQKDDIEGDYVCLTWMDIHQNEDSPPPIQREGYQDNDLPDQPNTFTTISHSTSTIRSKQNNPSTTASTTRKRGRPSSTLRHWQRRCLHIEVFLQEAWSASFVLFGSDSENEKSMTVSSFCFLRGQKSGSDFLWEWITTHTGWYIGKRPMSFSGSDLAHVVSTIVCRKTALPQSQQQQQHHRTELDPKRGNTKPLILTYGMTSNIPGIDSLSLTVPPQALAQLCRSMEECQPKTIHVQQPHVAAMEATTTVVDCTTTPNNTSGSISPRTSNIVENTNDTTTTRSNTTTKNCSSGGSNHSSINRSMLIASSSQQKQQLPPVLRALQWFVLEQFGLDVSKLRMNQIATDCLLLGCGGQCKLLGWWAMSDVLSVIQSICTTQKDGICQ